MANNEPQKRYMRPSDHEIEWSAVAWDQSFGFVVNYHKNELDS